MSDKKEFNKKYEEKLLVNIAINPLSALYDIKNGQLRAPYFNSIIFSKIFVAKIL